MSLLPPVLPPVSAISPGHRESSYEVFRPRRAEHFKTGVAVSKERREATELLPTPPRSVEASRALPSAAHAAACAGEVFAGELGLEGVELLTYVDGDGLVAFAIICMRARSEEACADGDFVEIREYCLDLHAPPDGTAAPRTDRRNGVGGDQHVLLPSDSTPVHPDGR
jgi:hypothetical protein